jgi:Ni,Fe-hydrogenase III large subunit
MNPTGWAEETAERFRRTDQMGLAYVSPSGDLALWNDYASHRSVLVRQPELGPEDLAVLKNWRIGENGPRPISVGMQVQGYGVFTFPYGPVAMGVAEAGSFDLRTYGERILELEPTVGYKRRGIDEQVIGRTVEDATLWVERRVAPFALAHASTFLFAAESAAGRAVPERELWVRALAQELQRVYNHLRVIARVADAASQNVGAAQIHVLEEDMLRTLGTVLGHRWGFGALVAHGPARQLEAGDRAALDRRLRELGRQFESLWGSFLASRTFIDRIQATGVISEQEARRWGAVGPTLRASSVAWDDRMRSATVPYTDLFLPLATEPNGDALARVLVRREEIRGSLLMLEQMLDRWHQIGDGEVLPAPAIAPGRGIARSEAPSGDLIYDVQIEGDRIQRVGVRTPSQANWPLVALSLRGAVFTDFAFSLESFGSSFAETDG